MGEDEEERGMEESGVFFIEFDLAFKVIPGVVEGVDFVGPEGFLVKGIESQCKTNDQTQDEEANFFSFHPTDTQQPH